MTNWQDISYKEFTSWATAAIVGSMMIYYVSSMLNLDSQGLLSTTTHNQLLFIVVVATIVTEIIVQTIIAITKRLEANGPNDERDKTFNLQASSISNYFISTFVALLILLVSQSDWLLNDVLQIWQPLTNKDILLFVLVLGFGVSQVLHHLILAVLYRRGS